MKVNKTLIREVDALLDRCLVIKSRDVVRTFFNAFILIELRRRAVPKDIVMTKRLKRLATLRATELIGNKEAVTILRSIATDALKETLGER